MAGYERAGGDLRVAVGGVTTPAMTRDVFPFDRTAPAAQQQILSFHNDFVAEVKAAVARDRVVVVGMAWNPFVTRAHAALRAAGVPFTRVDHGNYLKGYRRRLAIKMWTGFPTFPQVFVGGTFIGGFAELRRLIDEGGLKP